MIRYSSSKIIKYSILKDEKTNSLIYFFKLHRAIIPFEFTWVEINFILASFQTWHLMLCTFPYLTYFSCNNKILSFHFLQSSYISLHSKGEFKPLKFQEMRIMFYWFLGYYTHVTVQCSLFIVHHLSSYLFFLDVSFSRPPNISGIIVPLIIFLSHQSNIISKNM